MREIIIAGLGVIVFVYVAGKYVYSHFIKEDDTPISTTKSNWETSGIAKSDKKELIQVLKLVKEIKEKVK